MADLTAKARVREAALVLFAEQGFDGTSVRQIAAEADVSPGLVIHHFGSKQGVRDAVDEAVIAHFDAALDLVPTDESAEVISRMAGEALGSVIASSSTLRAYLRRALLEGNPSARRVLDRLVDALEVGIGRMVAQGMLRTEVVTRWLPYQVLFNSLGSLVFEPFLQHRLDGTAYAPDVLAERQAANVELMARGMLA
jgi:AcrR family transcriptional regulator